MSLNDKDQKGIEDLSKIMEKDAKLDKLKEEVQEKKLVLDQKRYTNLLEKAKEDEKDLETIKNADFGKMTDAQVEEVIRSSDDYTLAAKAGMTFICEAFHGIVPFFRKNFILIGAKTGEGKSTAAANIVHSVVAQKNPLTGKRCRALILTNEEKKEDFYNRITCLQKGWHYVNHDQFTDEQLDTFRKAIRVYAKTGLIMVVDNIHDGSHGATTSLEGIEGIFENLLAKGEHFDVVIIDYYQNITHSKKNPYLSENDIQAKLARMLDRYKNQYPAPIVLMCQITPQDKDERVPFQQRIKGRKMIMDPSTLAMEMVADHKKHCTHWKVWKSRFTQAIGRDITTGYEKGKFVPYSIEFQERIAREEADRVSRQMSREFDMANGIRDAFEPKLTVVKDEEDGK